MGKSIYLAGAITARRDKGVRWRRVITPFLKKYGYDVINDPTINEQQWYDMLPSYGAMSFKELKASNKQGFAELVKKIRSYDVDLIKGSDAILFYFDRASFKSDGTMLELEEVRRLAKGGISKEVYAIMRCPWSEVPGWTFCTIYHYINTKNHVFYTMSDFRVFIKEQFKGVK